MRKTFAALLVLAVLSGLASCAPTDDIVDTLVSLEPSPSPSSSPQIVIPAGPAAVEAFGAAYSSTATLDPISSASRLNLELAPLMYEGLFRLTADFDAENSLCESFTHAGDVWTFKLKRGIVMSDGEPLTSADVKYSLDRARQSARYGLRLSSILAVAPNDDYDFTITTNGACGRLELLLDVPIIRAGSGDEYAPVGSGLYEYVDAEGESYLRVAEAHRGEASIARIQLIDTPAAELMISNFEQGLISVASFDPTATARIDYGGDYEEWSYPTTNMIYLNFGARLDRSLRAILADAVDREVIAETDLFGAADASDLPANPVSLTGSRPKMFSLESCANRLVELGAEADESGVLHIGRTPLALRFVVPEENACKLAAAERIAADWRQLGFDVTLDALSFAEFKSTLTLGDFDVALCETQMRADFSLDDLIGEGGALNFGGYDLSEEPDETLAALLAAYRSADSERIGRAASALYDYVDRDAHISAVAFLRSTMIAKRGEVGAPDPTAHDLYRGIENW